MIGIPRRWLAAAGSSNDVAREWALGGAPHGSVVVVGNQTRGRGRRERVWIAPEGLGLNASLIWRRDWPSARAPDLGILAAMVAYRALTLTGMSGVSVKWPNDILVNGRKICGVLVEPRLGGDRIEFAVLGIGINVGQRAEDFPPGIREKSTSCAMEGAEVQFDRLLEDLVGSLEVLEAMPFDEVRSAWVKAGAKEEAPEL